MPKVSDDVDLSDGSEIAHDAPQPRSAKAGGEPTNGADAGSESDGDEDEYQVERIVSHKSVGKVIKYEIKWAGWPHSDNTFEPVDHLLPAAADVLAAYISKLGYDPATRTGKQLKRPESTPDLKKSAKDSSPPAKKMRKDENNDGSESWVPRTQDWEKEVLEITHIEMDSASNQLMVFVHWKNGKKTKVGMNKIRAHCPRPMLTFYEKHLKFTDAD